MTRRGATIGDAYFQVALIGKLARLVENLQDKEKTR
jgi:hypothetical protein